MKAGTELPGVRDGIFALIDENLREAVMLQRQEAAIQKVRKTLEIPQAQYIDETIDVPVVAQCQVPTMQAVQTVEVPQVQFPDRVVSLPVVMQRQVPQEQIPERIVETTDVPVPSVREEIIEVVDYVLQERVQNDAVEHMTCQLHTVAFSSRTIVIELIPEWLNFVKVSSIRRNFL